MIKQFFTAIIFILCATVTFARQEAVTKERLTLARQQIKQMGLAAEDVEFSEEEDVEIFSSCGNAVWDPGDPEYLMVKFKLKKAKVLDGLSLKEGAQIKLCDGRMYSMFSSGVHLIDGYKCSSSARFDLQGKLCACDLAETTNIEGIEIPKGVTTLWRKGKPYALRVAGGSVKIKGRQLEGGYHQFIKGKLKFQKTWESVDTCPEEIYNQ